MIAPVIIAVLFVLYLLSIALAFALADDIPAVGKLLFVVVPVILTGVMIGVTVSRIKEIRSGEEDDLSKY